MELELLQKIIAQVLRVDAREAVPSARFLEDLGADSLDMYQICTLVEKQFSIALGADDCSGMRTVSELLRVIQKKELVGARRLGGTGAAQ